MNLRRSWSWWSILVVLLASCATSGWVQEGQASFYGPGFHGRLTASGERFDMHAMTAAHRELPFGTVIRVTAVETGRSVRVIINDRGPFKAGRVLDLSMEAARRLGTLEKGVVPVRIEVLRWGGRSG